MNTNSVLLIIGALLLAAGLIYFAFGTGGGGTITQSASSVVAEESFHDFGEISIFGGTVETVFTLKNEGTEDVVIKSGTTSCGCTTAEIGGMQFGMHDDIARPFTIAAGETAEMTVTFDPLAHGPSGVGLAERLVYLKTNSNVTPELEVRIKALVTNSD
ncbi:MAG: DUF1573 domain-containing protein [bacterium]|nr:DUF1573 domain-containing protein [bacterium]